VIPIPKIALVGRPNVGKSTLFNRLVGQRKAITDGRPGSTRDRNYGQCLWRGAAYEVIDTGGLLAEEADVLSAETSVQAMRAVDESDLVILVVDGRGGLLPDDRAIAADLRRRGRKVIVAVNKSEGEGETGIDPEFTELGFEHCLSISAEHGIGVGDLLDAAFALLPRVVPIEAAERPLRLALVGCPNVGKSSILNRLLGEERSVVSPIPGTTRDSVDALLTRGGRQFQFVDTAGFRRRAVLKDGVDHVSVVQTGHSIRRCDVAVIVLDANEGVRETDVKVASEAESAHRGVVLVVNKWDGELAKSGNTGERHFTEEIRRHLKFVAHAPVRFVSAKTGRGLEGLLRACEAVRAACLERVTTGRLNRLLAEAVAALPPRTEKGGGQVKLLFGTQVGTAPPTFVLSLTRQVALHFSYTRYLENRIREEFGFAGAPIVLRVRSRRH
jgi:GTP-binding protein